MGKSARPFAPVAVSRDGESPVIPEWLRIAEPTDAEPVEVPHEHVLRVRERPEPLTAVSLTSHGVPTVERLAPTIRHFSAPRRVWVRRGVVAGALVASCAVLVSGIVLTSAITPSAPQQQSAAEVPATGLRDQVGGSGRTASNGGPTQTENPISSSPFAGSVDPGVRAPRFVARATPSTSAPVAPSSSAPQSPLPASPSPTPSPSPSPTETTPPPTEEPTTPPPTDPSTEPPTDESTEPSSSFPGVSSFLDDYFP